MKPVSQQELEYLRRHIREAIAEERIVCLECGAQMRNLGRHLVLTHELTVGEYRALWGYNRLAPLVCGTVLAQFSAQAKRRGLGTGKTRAMALAALRVRQQKEPLPLRREALECLRERPQHGQGVGPPRKISDADLLTLTAQGLSFDQIARLRGLARVTVWRRLARLMAQGHPIPSCRPRPAGGPSGTDPAGRRRGARPRAHHTAARS